MTISRTLAEWVWNLDLDEVPEPVRRANRLQVLDIIGVMIAAHDQELVMKAQAAVLSQGSGGDTPIFASNKQACASAAAMVNGVMAHLLEFDDSHPVSGAHTTTPVLAAVLPLALQNKVSGRALLQAVLAGNEIACRLGMVAPGAAHANGLHPTGVYGTLGAVFAVSKLLGLTVSQMVNALAIAASMCPTSIMASWEDGSSVKSLHAGFAASSAVSAALFAIQGIQGSPVALEGRFGFFRALFPVQRPLFDFEVATQELGERWEITKISSKMYPCGGAFQAHLDAAFDLMERETFSAEEIENIECGISNYFVPLVCEPVSEKRRPNTTWHARFSIQHSLAAAFATGRLDHDSYSEAAIHNPSINALADRVTYVVDEEACDRTRLLGEVRVQLRDGREFRSRNDMRGTERNPMKTEDYLNKFRQNARKMISDSNSQAFIDQIMGFESIIDVNDVLGQKAYLLSS